LLESTKRSETIGYDRDNGEPTGSLSCARADEVVFIHSFSRADATIG
jgi:hypothetical protein